MMSLRLKFLLAVLAVLTAASCGGTSDSSGDGLPQSFDILSLEESSVGQITVGAASDLPRVVNLWASWCPPCRAELPAFESVATDGASVVEIVGVNVGEDTETALALIEELGLTFPQIHDPDSLLSLAFSVTQMPSTAFINADGEVVEVHAGAYTEEELIASIEEHLDVTVVPSD